MFHLHKILFLTQVVGNQRCIEIEWTIQNCNPLRWLNYLWNVLDSCNCLWARKRTKCSIYLLKKKNSLVYVFFPQMRNISPKALRSCQFSYLKPSQVGILPFHFPWTHLICLKPCNLNPSLHENETNAPFSLPLLCIFPFLRICRGSQDAEDKTRSQKSKRVVNAHAAWQFDRRK